MKFKTAVVFFCLANFWAVLSSAAAEDYLAAGDNLVIEGVPKIPMELVDDVRRYTEFRDDAFASWHPTKREMLIFTRFANTYQVHQVKFPGGARTQLTFFNETVGDASYEPVTGNYFVFSKDSGGDENYQKYRYDFATGAITLLTDGKSRNTGGVWSHSGAQYVYGSTRRNGRDVDLWVMNPVEPKSDRMLVQLEGGGWAASDFSSNDRQLLISEYISADESRIWLFDMDSGKRTLIAPKDDSGKAYFANPRFSGDGKSVYFITDLDSEFHRLARIDLATKNITWLTGDVKWDVDELALSWDGRRLAYNVNQDGLSVLHLLDTRTGKELPAPALPAGIAWPDAWHKNNRDLGFVFQSSQHPWDCYSLDIKTGKTERWTTSETGGINTEGFATPEVVHWNSFDGRSISGLLYRPPAKFSGKRPVIIDIHGGPEDEARPWFQGRNSYFVNELGVAVIQPNVRGSTGFGKTFLDLDNGFLREGAYKDIGALLDWIKTQPDLDADRIMVTGASYGGHMTLAVATYYPERIRCALDVCGESDLATFLEHTSGYRQDLRRVEYGDERDPKMREFLNRIAPLNNASKITKPLFVVQGGDDPRVPVSESMQMVEAVRKNGTPVWYLMAKDEGHGFGKKQNRDYLLYSTVLFVKEYLMK